MAFDPFEERKEYLRRLWDYRQGENDARFGNPKKGFETIDYGQGYDRMEKFCKGMKDIEEKNNQLMKKIDAIKMHKPFFW